MKKSKHTWIVDVIEDGSASIEVDGRAVTPIPAWLLPEGVREGDVVRVEVLAVAACALDRRLAGQRQVCGQRQAARLTTTTCRPFVRSRAKRRAIITDFRRWLWVS